MIWKEKEEKKLLANEGKFSRLLIALAMFQAHF